MELIDFLAGIAAFIQNHPAMLAMVKRHVPDICTLAVIPVWMVDEFERGSHHIKIHEGAIILDLWIFHEVIKSINLGKPHAFTFKCRGKFGIGKMRHGFCHGFGIDIPFVIGVAADQRCNGF